MDLQQTVFDPSVLDEWRLIDPTNWKQVAVELIDLFLKLAPQQYSQLKTSWQKSDWQQASLIAHSLKSSCGNIGASKARIILDALETNLNDMNLNAAHHLMRDLDEVFDVSVAKANAFRTELLQADLRAS